MVIGGLLQELYYINDIIALLYTSIFGSAVSYGVYFYSAAKGSIFLPSCYSITGLCFRSLMAFMMFLIAGSLTKLSSLTFLTPMFASIFGVFFLSQVSLVFGQYLICLVLKQESARSLMRLSPHCNQQEQSSLWSPRLGQLSRSQRLIHSQFITRRPSIIFRQCFLSQTEIYLDYLAGFRPKKH